MKAFFNQRHTAKKFGLAALGVAVTMGAGHLNAAPLKEELETLVLTHYGPAAVCNCDFGGYRKSLICVRPV